MSIIESIANFFEPSPAPLVVTVNSGADYENLPIGFFNVIAQSGRESLGYNGGFLSWNVGATVVDGGQRVTLSVPKNELPAVLLNFQRPIQDGVTHQIGGATIIDTEALDTDEPVVWSGQQPRSSEWI